MKIELQEQSEREMWFYDRNKNEIWPIHIIAESRSGKTVDTNYGERLRTSTKKHAVFYSWDFARIAQKMELNELDSEYDEILARNNLRRVKAA
jgi:hypothetical protein